MLLRALASLLARPSLLGVELRVNLFDDSFNTADRLLREAGLTGSVASVLTYLVALPPLFLLRW